MFLHGSPEKFSEGDVLVPGDTIGKSFNGGKSDFVYVLHAVNGVYSISDFDDDFGMSSVEEISEKEAEFWAGEGGYVYQVKPLGEIHYDEHHDVTPNSFKTERAVVLKVLKSC